MQCAAPDKSLNLNKKDKESTTPIISQYFLKINLQ
jgi:hypothetical protein